jgi:hypothetical protein
MYIYCIYIIYICIWSRTPPWSTFSLFYWYLQYRTFIFPVHIPGCVWPYVYIYIYTCMQPLKGWLLWKKNNPWKKQTTKRKQYFETLAERTMEKVKKQKNIGKKQNKTKQYSETLAYTPLSSRPLDFFIVYVFFFAMFFFVPFLHGVLSTESQHIVG